MEQLLVSSRAACVRPRETAIPRDSAGPLRRLTGPATGSTDSFPSSAIPHDSGPGEKAVGITFLMQELGLTSVEAWRVCSTFTDVDSSGENPCRGDGLERERHPPGVRALAGAIALAKRDSAIERRILEHLRLRVYRMARHLLSAAEPDRGEAAEDIAQDVVIRLWQDDYRRLRAWHGRGTLGHYLAIIVRNAIIDRGRRRALPQTSLSAPKSEGSEEWETIDLRDPDPGPEARTLFRHQQELVGKAVRRLPDRQRELICRHYYRDQDCHRIARETGISSGYAAVLLFRARQTLKTYLSDQLES